MTTLDDLAGEPRWVAWRNEPRAGSPEKVTKVPYSPRGRKAKADDPATWGTRAQGLRMKGAGEDLLPVPVIPCGHFATPLEAGL